MRSRLWLTIGSLVTAATAALGQTSQLDAPTELRRAERARSQNQAEVERLLDLRLRHDLGLPGDGVDSTFRPAAAVTPEQMTRMQRELEDEDAQTRQQLAEYNRLRQAVDQLLADASERAKRDAQDRPYVDVPVIGAAASRPTPRIAQSGTTVAETSPAPGSDSGPVAPRVRTEVDTHGLDPLRAQIHGSENHQIVASALFKAGQTLCERAAVLRNQGQLDIAKDLDDRGRQWLSKALDELAPLVKDKEVPFEALFCQGRCRELLFRYSERHEGLSLTTSQRDYQRREQEVRDSFLAIMVRDVRKTGARGEVEVLGSWGMAAQSAMEHFRWVNLHGSYETTARAAIDSLTWPGEQPQ